MHKMTIIALLQLPLEVLVHILKNLNLHDLRNVMLTCNLLKDLILMNSELWKSVCKNRMIVHNSSDNLKPNRLSCYNQYRISSNWCSGVYRKKIIFHIYASYMPWLMFYNSEALLQSIGSELRCFPTDRKNHPVCKETLWKWQVPTVKRNDIRTNDISRFIIADNVIVCGNRDGCVTVLKYDDMQQKPRLLHHFKDCHEDGLVEVSAVEVIANTELSYAITGSIYDSTVCYWFFNMNEYRSSPNKSCQENITTKSLGPVGIRCMSLDNTKEKLAIGPNGNSKPLLLDNNTCELVINSDLTINSRQTIRDIRWHDNNTILYVTHSGKLQMLDVRTNHVVYDVMDPFQSTLYCVKSDGDRAIVVGTSEYSRCVLFDVRNSACHTQMYFTQKMSSPVYSLDFDSTKLIAASDRGMAALNFNIKRSSEPQRDYSQKFEFIS